MFRIKDFYYIHLYLFKSGYSEPSQTLLSKGVFLRHQTQTHFHTKDFCTRTRFETKARGNSEMAYSYVQKLKKFVWNTVRFIHLPKSCVSPPVWNILRSCWGGRLGRGDEKQIFNRRISDFFRTWMMSSSLISFAASNKIWRMCSLSFWFNPLSSSSSKWWSWQRRMF